MDKLFDGMLAIAATSEGMTLADFAAIRGRAPYARSAVYQVLREEGWYLIEIGRMAGKNHATIHHQIERSRDRERRDRRHAMLLVELRRYLHVCKSEEAKHRGLEVRARVALESLEHEIATLAALRAEISSAIRKAERESEMLTQQYPSAVA